MTPRRKLTGAKRLAAVVIAGGAAAAVLGACAQSPDPSGDVGNGPAKGSAVEVVASDNSFEPATLNLEPGKEVTVEITNEGSAPHDFTIEDLDLSTGTIESGETVTATFTVPDDETKFVCTIHGGMEGRIAPTSAD